MAPSKPSVSNFSRNGDVGTITVSNLDPGCVAHIYGIHNMGTLDTVEVGSTDLNGGVVLDLTGFIGSFMGIQIPEMASFFAIAEDAGGVCSVPSKVTPGLLDFLHTASLTGIVRSEDRTQVTVTVAGLVNASDLAMVFYASAGVISVTGLQGNGDHVISGVPDAPLSFTVIGYSHNGYIYAPSNKAESPLCWSEDIGGVPYSEELS